MSQPLAPAPAPATFPGVDGGRVPMPAGWGLEPASSSACGRVPAAESGLAASPPGDFTVALRALRWPEEGAGLAEAVRACGGRPDGYAGRFDRLGLAIEARGVLVRRAEGSFLLEMEAPVAKVPHVEALFERWVREAAGP